MSAIWGAIVIEKGKTIAANAIKCFQNAYKKCAIDRTEEICDSEVYMGCGIQYIFPEAEYEQLPCVSDGVFFTADVMLDNRKELLEKLQMEDGPTVSDGFIYQNMRTQFGNKADDMLIGAYDSVCYNSTSRVIEIVADAVGYRFVHYMIENGVFYFSTLIDPLFAIQTEKKSNPKWMANFLGQDNLGMYLECSETPYKGIYRTEPAERITVQNGRIKKEIYWNPFKSSNKVRFKSDAEYKKAFRDLYKECVDCVLRSQETAVYLSGGFDSTSVAVQAASELQKKGKALYAYTAVPLSEFTDEDSRWEIQNEAELVKKTAEQYPNIVCNFMELRDVDSWHERLEYVPIAEQPYKSPQNLIWLYRGAQLAAEQGARIILSGSFGNGTVSFENVREYLVWLFQHFKYRHLWREITALGSKMRYTRKSILIATIKDAFAVGEKRTKKEEAMPQSFVRLEWLNQFDTIDTVLKNDRLLQKSRRNHRLYQKVFLDRVNFRHYSEFAQRNSLYTGVILRDPTRDRRLIEFVLGLPYNQFTNDGIRRRLISEYMVDVMPAHIVNERRKGVQSADMKLRLCMQEDSIKQEWIELLKKYPNHPIIDTQKAIESLQSKSMKDMSHVELRRFIYTIIYLEFSERFSDD